MSSKIIAASRLLSKTISNKWNEIKGNDVNIKFLDYEITDGCNSRCSYCSIWETQASEDVLTGDKIIEIFSQDMFSNLETMIITGGEAFLRKDINKILKGIHDNIPGIFFALSTNGLTPNKVVDTAKFCLENNISFAVGISLDDVGEMHDFHRGVKGNFKKVDELIDNLLAVRMKENANFPILVAHCLSDDGIDTLDNIKEYAQQKGIVFLTQLIEEYSYYDNYMDEESNKLAGIHHEDTPKKQDAYKRPELAADQIRWFMSQTPSGLRTYDPKNRKSGMVLSSNSKYASNDPLVKALDKIDINFHSTFLREVLRKGSVRFDCYALRNFYFMRANGDVTPCLRFGHVSVGNLGNESADAIFNGEKAQEARSFIKNCDGCANTWASDWSLEGNMIPFVPILIKSQLRKIKNRL